MPKKKATKEEPAVKAGKCRHADAENRCANPDANGQGRECLGCEDHEAAVTAIGKTYEPAVDVESIAPSRYQTRKTLGDISALAADIAVHGIMNPVTVRKAGDGFELIAGHRRLAGAKEAGLSTIPAIVATCDDGTAAEMCVVENMQRVDLTPIEEAEGIKALLDTGHTQQDAADRIGRSVKWVARRANLLNLIPEIRDAIGDADNALGLIPIAGLELIAALPEYLQNEVKRRCAYNPTTVGLIQRVIAESMRDLAKAPFVTADCQVCQKRTGAQPDLFDTDLSGTCPLGNCMDPECFTERRNAAMITMVEDLRKKDPDVVIVADSYAVRETVAGAVTAYQVAPCKKSDKGAKVAYKIDEAGNARKIYILASRGGEGSSGSTGESADTSAQPTKEQRRKAAVCRHMTGMIDSHLKNGEALPTNPMRSHGIGKLLEFMLVTGTICGHSSPDATEWDELEGKPHGDLADLVWAKIAPVLRQRVKYYKVSECEAYYDEACAIAERVFGVSKEDLDEAAE